ncbi:MAG: hypothetical protein AB7P37_03495 [Ramlibacter sp.]
MGRWWFLQWNKGRRGHTLIDLGQNELVARKAFAKLVASIQRQAHAAAAPQRRQAHRQTPEFKAKLAHHARKRRAGLQMPAWADLAAIEQVYQRARQLTMATGIVHHVDHHYPLQGRLVCGLHVHQNLDVLPATDNQKKYNRMPDTPECWPLESTAGEKCGEK